MKNWVVELGLGPMHRPKRLGCFDDDVTANVFRLAYIEASGLSYVSVREVDEDPKLTMRDQFAMAALHGLLAADSGALTSPDPDLWPRASDPAQVARDSYTIADAMLKARQK